MGRDRIGKGEPPPGEDWSLIPHIVGVDGHHRVILWKDEEAHIERVDELVLLAFGGSRPTEDHVVEHIDGDPGNDFIENLRWVLP